MNRLERSDRPVILISETVVFPDVVLLEGVSDLVHVGLLLGAVLGPVPDFVAGPTCTLDAFTFPLPLISFSFSVFAFSSFPVVISCCVSLCSTFALE